MHTATYITRNEGWINTHAISHSQTMIHKQTTYDFSILLHTYAPHFYHEDISNHIEFVLCKRRHENHEKCIVDRVLKGNLESQAPKRCIVLSQPTIKHSSGSRKNYENHTNIYSSMFMSIKNLVLVTKCTTKCLQHQSINTFPMLVQFTHNNQIKR